MDRSIIGLVLNSFLLAMQAKQHFDIKKLSQGVSQLIGELPPEECKADLREFSRLTMLFRKKEGNGAFVKLLAICDKLTEAERRMFHAIVSSRRSISSIGISLDDVRQMSHQLDDERIEFLKLIVNMSESEALAFLRTGIGIAERPGLTQKAKWYTEQIATYVSEKSGLLVGWAKAGALKTHAAIIDTTPREQSIISVLLGWLLIGGTNGRISTATEIEFLNRIFARKGEGKREA